MIYTAPRRQPQKPNNAMWRSFRPNSQLPGEQRITDPPRPRPVEQRFKKSSDLGGLGKLPLWRFFKIIFFKFIYLYIQTCPRAFSVHFLQASIIAKFCHKVLKIKFKKKKILHQQFSTKKCVRFCSYIVRKSIELSSFPPVMSQEFFKKYFLVNFSDAQGLKPLLFVMLYIDAQAAVTVAGAFLQAPSSLICWLIKW